MSFTRQVKQELSRQAEGSPCCRSWELLAMILLRGSVGGRENRQVLTVRVDYNIQARYLFSLLKTAGAASPSVAKEQGKKLGKNYYLVQVVGPEQVEALLIYLQLGRAARSDRLVRFAGLLPHRRCCRRAFSRGAFLAAGSISVDGRSGYHLEINCSCREDALALQECLGVFAVQAYLRRHNGCHSVYLKKAEAIADFLRVIEASSALLYLENIRVFKSMRNQVNRLVNCDTANLDKVVISAQQQLELINRIDRRFGLSSLTPSLRDAARIRRRHPEASLKELGEMLDPPVGKSGMNHRFRQLERIAGECRAADRKQ